MNLKMLVGDQDWKTEVVVWLRRAARKWYKKYLISIIVILVAWGYTWGVVRYTEHRVTKEVTQEVTLQMRSNFARWLEEQETEKQAQAFLSGDASKREAIKTEATYLAKAFYGVSSVVSSNDEYRTYGWTLCFRTEASNKEFPNSIEGVVSQKNQLMGYSEENPVVDGLYTIAEEILTDYYNGNWPTTSIYTYVDWSTGKMIARNDYKTGPNTLYWWWGK